MVKVFTQGSFDLLHYGHLKYLKKVKKQGDFLIVGVNTDELYKNYKDKEPILPYKQRSEIVRNLKCVDLVIPAREFSPLKLLKKHKIDIFVIYKEWKDTKKEEIEYMKKIGKKIVVVSFSNKNDSSSKIKDKISKNFLPKEKLKKISKIVKSWNIKNKPEYRRYKCGNCLKAINKAWHIWFEDDGFKCEVHLCNKCKKEILD